MTSTLYRARTNKSRSRALIGSIRARTPAKLLASLDGPFGATYTLLSRIVDIHAIRIVMKTFVTLSLLATAALSQAQLYGVGGTNGNYHFYSINTSNGAATNIFNFSVPNTTNVVALTYIPTTNRFVTTAQVSAFSSKLVELDLGAQTGTVVSTGIPNNSSGTPYFEGLEYMASLGGLVVSHGIGGFYTGQLGLLNPVGYGLLNTTGMILADADTVFMDGSGDLNVLDTNNPTGGFMRNKIFSPFGLNTTVGYGSNMFSATDSDLAWKGDEGRLFLTQGTSLSTVNSLSTSITSVGSYGIVNSDGSLGTITGLAAVPEPGSLLATMLGAALLIRRRRS